MGEHLYWEEHAGRGPYLLLVHGVLSSRAQWLDNLGVLGEFCRPVVIELFGHGRSPSPSSPRCYGPAGYIAEFERIRKLLGARQWYVCGYSLGAGLTIRYALGYPERVRAHIFTNSSSGFADASTVSAWRSQAEDSAQRILSGGIKAIERIAVHPRNARRLPEHIGQALVEDAKLLNPLGVANTFRYTNPDASVRSLVPDNSLPAMLICGTREKRFAGHLGYVRDHMPQIEIAEVDAGHGVNMEAADGFNEAVRTFLGKHPMQFEVREGGARV